MGRHYDELDVFYRELWGEHLHHGLWRAGEESPEEAAVALVELVADRSGIAPGDTVCDVGSGYGGPARLLADRWSAEVVGLTISRTQYTFASARSAPGSGVRFLLRDWLENGLPSESFDVVIAVESSEHVDDKRAFFREALRVLRPDGRLAVAAWLAADAPRAWERRHLLEPICSEGRIAGLGEVEEYRRWIADAGFEAVRFEELTRRVRPTWDVCLRRVAGRLLTDPGAWSYLIDSRRTERRFALTVLRLWLAYRTGCLRYGLFTAIRGKTRLRNEHPPTRGDYDG